MKLDVKAMALTIGLTWGVLVMFVTGCANLVWGGFGQAFLDVMASFYPGYDATPSFGQVMVGTLYGLLDGVVVGAIVSWLYNRFAAG